MFLSVFTTTIYIYRAFRTVQAAIQTETVVCVESVITRRLVVWTGELYAVGGHRTAVYSCGDERTTTRGFLVEDL